MTLPIMPMTRAPRTEPNALPDSPANAVPSSTTAEMERGRPPHQRISARRLAGEAKAGDGREQGADHIGRDADSVDAQSGLKRRIPLTCDGGDMLE